jgi:hypothetical protein
MKTPERSWILHSLTSREFAKDNRGRFILFEGHPPPRIEDYPRGFNNPRKNPWSYEKVVETIIDRNHKGAPTYVLLDSNVGRVTKIVGPKQ